MLSGSSVAGWLLHSATIAVAGPGAHQPALARLAVFVDDQRIWLRLLEAYRDADDE